MKGKVSLYLLIFTLSFSLFTVSSYAAELYNDNVPYEFEIYPGTEAWKSYDKVVKLEQLQIPENKLSSMSTQALLETVLDYPYISDYKFFNTARDAYETFMTEFNGFAELMDRADLTEVLIEQYEVADVMTKTEYDAYVASEQNDNVSFTKKFFYTSTLEFLLVCDDIHSGEQTERINTTIEELINQKATERLATGLYSVKSNVYDKYISDVTRSNQETRVGAYGTYSSVLTPNGTSVLTIYDSFPDVDNDEAWAAHIEVLEDHPNVSYLSRATVKYNCHSYAWYSQTTTNKHWMNDPSAYMTDGSYYRNTTSPRVGMKAYWPTGGHSGVVSRIEYVNGSHIFYITSKWGDYGLYEHVTTDCPYGGAIHFYTRN